MIPRPTAIMVNKVVATCFLGISVYLAYRMVQIQGQVHRVGWDLDALAGALRKREENETPERSHH